MELRKKNIGNGSYLVEIYEELDLYSSTDFRNFIQELFQIHQPEGIILSLKHLEYLDSSGVGVLLALVRRCNKYHCQLILCEVKKQSLEVIRMTQLHRIFHIENNEFQGLKKMNELLSKNKRDSNSGPILIDERHNNLKTDGMKHKSVNIDYKRIRYISHVITQSAPESIKEHNLLEQQVSEIIKNAVRHGNKNDITKNVAIWWNFTPHEAHLIVEDQGSGFQNLEEWNAFFHKRMECFLKGDSTEMMDYLSYRTEESKPDDGGNALFAAIEYWNGGYVLNEKRNRVGLKRRF